MFSLVGKTVIITGGTSGLGRETALELSLKGARIILVSRYYSGIKRITKRKRIKKNYPGMLQKAMK